MLQLKSWCKAIQNQSEVFLKIKRDRIALLSANDMKIFIVLPESPLKVRKIAVYRFLISLLVLELLRSKDLKIDRKNGTKNARS